MGNWTKNIIHLFIACFTFIFSGCFSEEEPVEPYPRGGMNESLIKLGDNYVNQIFFDLGSNSIISAHSRYDWDLGFSCIGTDHIKLNSGRNMMASPVVGRNLTDVKDTVGLNFRWDWSTGNLDSFALNGWDTGVVFVVNMGLDEDFDFLGFMKIKVALLENEWIIQYAPLNESSEGSIRESRVKKNESLNYVCFSMLNNEVATIEPPKDSYDLIFTQYIYYFEEEALPYLVLGALLNPFQTEAYRAFDMEYSAIDASSVMDSKFNANWDMIGYNWKYFDLNTGVYETLDKQTYVLRDNEGFVYKFKFTGFYNSSGDKGYPTIAFETI